MARVKRAVHAKKHHRAVLALAQGYYGNKSRSYRAAHEQVMHSLQYAFRDRLPQGRVPAPLGDQDQRRLQGQQFQLQPLHRRAKRGGCGNGPQNAC